MEASLLPRAWSVPEQLRDRLGAKVGRQRAMVADGHLLLVLHAPPKPDENEREGRLFWRSPDGTWTSTAFGAGVQALNQHLDEYQNTLGQLDEREAKATLADEYFDVVEATAPIWRAGRNLHAALQDARKQCKEYRELINLRDRAYEIERTAELLYTAAQNGLDLAIAKRAEEQSRSSRQMAVSAHRLNMLVAFFFPIATLSAIFGTNLQHGFENAPPPTAFLVVLGAGLLMGGFINMFLTRPAD